MTRVFFKNDGSLSEVNGFGIKQNGVWTSGSISNVFVKQNGTWVTTATTSAVTSFKFAGRSYSNLEISGAKSVTSESCTYVALVNGREVNNATWSLDSGLQYASFGANGLLIINNTANGNQITIRAEYGELSATMDAVITYSSGSSSETSSETVINEDTDELTNITTTVTENEDGTESTSVTTIVYGSDGEPSERTNEVIDPSGNIDTQQIAYDENGEEVIVGYAIDTSNNPDGVKSFSGDGVNTEYYAFDLTQGFVIDFNFTIDFSNQPPNQDENHHNILTMKRATPEPWYGFQLRQTSTNKYIILGTQFSGTNNTNTTISPTLLTGTTAEYNLRITYNPTASTNIFVCENMVNGAVIYSKNAKFPDIEELKYLKVTIGYAMNASGGAYRYSNINVKNFQISKLTNIAAPTIACNNNEVTMACDTVGATIRYRLNGTGVYLVYSSAFTIYDDTFVQAYAEIDSEKSPITSYHCQYESDVKRPTIYCDGEIVTIVSDTSNADIYYRLNETGDYALYSEEIEITADTIVQAYAQIGGTKSATVTENCIYSPVQLTSPVIMCNGTQVTIECSTQGSVIYYRLDQSGSYILYDVPIPITADTIVEAYSQYRGRVSSVVTENCIYNPAHDYSQDYLTLSILSGGTIKWNSIGSGQAKTIQYSLNNGQWTSITASTATTITVAAGDSLRLKGTNVSYASSKSNYSGFEGGTATFNAEGNIMSLIYGDNFLNKTTFSGGTYNFCSLFKLSSVVSAENLVLPCTTLTEYCYRALFSKCTTLTTAPKLPALTLTKGCYWYMFEECGIQSAPELLAPILVQECYGNMFTGCTHLNFIKCLAIDGFNASNCKQNWVKSVSSSGTFVKDSGVSVTTWTRGASGIPTSWVVVDETAITPPEIMYDGFSIISLSCSTVNANIYYRLDKNGAYSGYSSPITITADTTIEAYSELNTDTSRTVSEYCQYVSDVPYEASNRDLTSWRYNGQTVSTPYSVNAIDGHSSSYAKGEFTFETSFALREKHPAYLWFQHADQSASIYIDNTLVEKHWGGYNAFFTDISEYVHSGTNEVMVVLKNNEGNKLAPAAGDFNFNATLGNVKLFTSEYMPLPEYGYDGFHVTSTVSSDTATINVMTTIPSGASVTLTIDDGTYHHTETKASENEEIIFITTISNPHLWNGTSDPHLYTITMEIRHNGDLYHRYVRPYGLRYYEYVIDDTEKVGTAQNPYTGFLLNGSPYLLRGVCMHDDIDGKANALTDSDYTQTFSIIQELGCNFIRLAHYPHPKEVYDRCDALGIVVQTEVPCVNKMQTTMPNEYYTHLEGQYTDMVNQHYNHPCIIFWSLSNETTTDDKNFAKGKIESYTSIIKNLDSDRWVGYVLSQGNSTNPSAYFNNPNVDWFGCNIYVGWYDQPNMNTPVNQLNTRTANTITALHKPMAFSEYGCGGTQRCHSDDFMTTTTRGNYERHDIEYMMWLHEGHIATIKQYPQLLFTAQWQLFDIAVYNRNEGYTVCLDGENTSIDDNLRRLNDKGLVERDHRTKKDAFYLYKAWWNPAPFIHICGKNYTKTVDRVIKCYTNDGNSASLYVNDTFIETVTVTNNIASFTARTFTSGDTVRVQTTNSSDSFEI